MPNVVLDDSVLAAERVLVSQPVIDPLCRVTLLLGDLQVVLEDLIDDALERVQLGTAWWFAPLVPGRCRILEHLAHGVPMQPEHPGRFTNAHPFDVAGSANPAIQLHCVHPFHLLSEHCQSIVLCS